MSRDQLKMAKREGNGQKGVPRSLNFFLFNSSFTILTTSPGSCLALCFISSQALGVERQSHVSCNPSSASALHHPAPPKHSVTGQLHILLSSRLVLRTSARNKTSVYPAGFESQKVPNLNLPKYFPPHKISVLLSGKQTLNTDLCTLV